LIAVAPANDHQRNAGRREMLMMTRMLKNMAKQEEHVFIKLGLELESTDYEKQLGSEREAVRALRREGEKS
jgi:hypothetical protein